MGQRSSPASTSEYDSNSVLEDHDSVTSKVIAELGLQDIHEISKSRKGQAGAQAPSSDEELALILQREFYNDTIQTIDDHVVAKSLSHAIDRRSQREAAIVEQVAQDDRRTALALSNTEQLQPRPEAQRLMDHPIFREVIKPPPKDGRYGSIKTNPLSPSALHLSTTFAQNIGDHIQPQNVPNGVIQEDIPGMRPRYMRYNYWGEADVFSETLADWSMRAEPLPDPPGAELKNPVVLNTVNMNPSLFKIVTPIKVDLFEEFLIDHPKSAFVTSVCKGLREGFWPFADTHIGDYPDTYDGSIHMPRDPAEVEFLRKQRDIEIDKGRFSESFGKKLLPGMYSSPLHAVRKRGTRDFRFVTDHSGGNYSLNSMIDSNDIAGVPLDNMRHLKEKLLAAHASGQKLTLWKSDVAEAYRLCPMHPHWQIKQVKTIDGEHYIDRNNTFGNRASFKIWGSVNSLVMWIAEHEGNIDRPSCYSDDTFGVCDANDTQFYKPYNRSMPRDQCKLLELWDLLGIPHKEKKQLSGNPLTIIGIEVDAHKMTMTLPSDAKTALIRKMNKFIAQPNGKAVSFTCKKFQRFAGAMNAALNVFPLLCPALTNIRARIGEVDRTSGKSNAQILCDTAIRNDLIWALKHIQNAKGIRILQDLQAWKPEEADIALYTKSNLKSMVFWYPDLKPTFAYYFDIPSTPSNLEHFLKALCVASAFLDAASRRRSSSRIVIYTENPGIVNMFDSFHCSPVCNPLLKAVADSMIQHKHKLKVLQVSGEKNVVANLLSKGSFADVHRLVPGLTITSFKPSDKLLGPLKS